MLKYIWGLAVIHISSFLCCLFKKHILSIIELTDLFFSPFPCLLEQCILNFMCMMNTCSLLKMQIWFSESGMCLKLCIYNKHQVTVILVLMIMDHTFRNKALTLGWQVTDIHTCTCVTLAYVHYLQHSSTSIKFAGSMDE